MTTDAASTTIADLAARTVEYVRRAVGVALEYDSDTLPLLDHYLREVPGQAVEVVELVVTTAGAYFGDVVIRHLGGRWEMSTAESREWRVVLPTGIAFKPAAFVAVAIARREVGEFDDTLDVPARIRPHFDAALARMGDRDEQEYFSLCGRLDMLEHLSEVLVGVAAQLMNAQLPAEDDGKDEDDDEVEEVAAPAAPPPPDAIN